MDSEAFRQYLTVLRQLTQTLEELTALEKEKTDAVRSDELDVLNRCMQREQAISLKLRGYDRKRETMLGELGIAKSSLRDLEEQAPDELHLEAKKVAEDLRTQYQQYQAAAKVARNTLEINLHEIEKILAAQGADPGTIGYEEPTAELPPNMHTDIRA